MGKLALDQVPSIWNGRYSLATYERECLLGWSGGGSFVCQQLEGPRPIPTCKGASNSSGKRGTHVKKTYTKYPVLGLP